METERRRMVSRYDVVARIQTPVVAVEIRDTYVDEEGDLLLAFSDVLLGSPLSSIPPPSIGRPEPGDRYGEVGDVIFVPSHAPWRFHSGAGAFRTVTSVYSRETFEAASGRDGERILHALDRCQHIRNRSISGALERLAAEVQSPGFASAVMVEGLGLCLLADLARLFSQAPSPTPERRGLTSAQLRAVRELVMDARGRQPSLSELSSLCGLGRRTFTRRFRASTGQSVGEWISEQKIGLAKQLLAAGALSIKQIAFELGFSTPSNFSVAFRRMVGATPSAFARAASAPGPTAIRSGSLAAAAAAAEAPDAA